MDLKGKCILVTGGTSGLGLEIARELAGRGATVYAMGRSLKGSFSDRNSFRFIPCDFADLRNIKNSLEALLDEGIRFDITVNNAGILTSTYYSETVNGFELSFQVNFLSHLLINEIIFQRKSFKENPVLFSVSSPVYRSCVPGYLIPGRDNFRFFRIYSETKYYLLLLGDFFRKQYQETGFSFIGFDPGIFNSGIYRSQRKWFHYIYRLGAPFMKSPASVAKAACNALEKKYAVINPVYGRRGVVLELQIAEKRKADDFMKTCLEALKQVSGLF